MKKLWLVGSGEEIYFDYTEARERLNALLPKDNECSMLTMVNIGDLETLFEVPEVKALVGVVKRISELSPHAPLDFDALNPFRPFIKEAGNE